MSLPPDAKNPEVCSLDVEKHPRVDKVPTIFLSATPAAAVILVGLSVWIEGFVGWWVIALSAIFYILTAISITAGYHRLIAHRAYEVPKWVELLLLLFGAAAFQNSVLKWATDHRFHHRFVDEELDPYSIRKGFWWAHLGWMVFKRTPNSKRVDEMFNRDLRQDKLIMWQHNYYLPIAIFMCFFLPMLIGGLFGSMLAGLAYAGALRLVLAHHATFLINSAAHTWGAQTYSDKHSARDSAVLAFFTCGEGYHNFHHEFQYDYRNGIRWFDFDPTKWLIQGLYSFGLASNLKSASPALVMRARLKMEEKKLKLESAPLFPHFRENLDKLNLQLQSSLDRWEKLRLEYQKIADERTAQAREKVKQIKIELNLAQREFRRSYQAWRNTTMLCLRTM